MLHILCEDLMMLRFSNTKSSMLYNLLSVDEAQMFVFEALLEKKQFNMSVPVNMSVHFYTGSFPMAAFSGFQKSPVHAGYQNGQRQRYIRSLPPPF